MSIHYWSGGSSYPMEGGTIYSGGSSRTIAGTDYWAYGGSNYKVGILPFSISSGGVQSNCMSYADPVNGYQLTVRSGGNAESVSLPPTGALVVSSGGTASIRFDPIRGPVTSHAGATVTYLERRHRVYYANSTIGTLWKGISFISSSALPDTYVFAYSGGVVSSSVISGTLMMYEGAIGSNVDFSGGAAYIYSGAVMNSASSPENGGHIRVFSGGSANGVRVQSGAIFSLNSGGTATNINGNTNGDFRIEGGYVSGLYTVGESGGHYTSVGISNGAVVNNIKIYNGSMHTDSNVSITSLTVGAGTWATLRSGCVASWVNLEDNTSTLIMAGASALAVSSAAGAVVQNFGYITYR